MLLPNVGFTKLRHCRNIPKNQRIAELNRLSAMLTDSVWCKQLPNDRVFGIVVPASTGESIRRKFYG